MSINVDFEEENQPQLDFLADEDVAKAAVQIPQAITSTLSSALKAGAPASEMGRQQAMLGRLAPAPMERAPTAPGSEGEGGVSATEGLARFGGEALRTMGQVVNPMTFMPEQEAPKPFIISPEGIRQMTGPEAKARSPLYTPNVPLIPVRGTQLQPTGSDAERQLASLSTLDNIALMAAGAESQVVGMAMLADMAPQAFNAVRDIARSDITPEQKRDQINALVMPLAIGLRHMKPQGTEALTPNEIAAAPEPMEFSGAAIPNLPRGATPVIPTAGKEFLGPNAPRWARPGIAEPSTPPEPLRGVSAVNEIRTKNARTKEQIRALFPQLSREQAAQLRDTAWGTGNEEAAAPPAPVAAAPAIPTQGPQTIEDAIRTQGIKTPEELFAEFPALAQGRNVRQRARQLIDKANRQQPTTPPPAPPEPPAQAGTPVPKPPTPPPQSPGAQNTPTVVPPPGTSGPPASTSVPPAGEAATKAKLDQEAFARRWKKQVEAANKPVTAEDLLKRPPESITWNEMNSLSTAEAVKLFSARKPDGSQAVRPQAESPLYGATLPASDLARVEGLRDAAMAGAMKAIKIQDNDGYMAGMGKVAWYNGVIEGIKRDGPNYKEALARKQQAPQAPPAAAPVAPEAPAASSKPGPRVRATFKAVQDAINEHLKNWRWAINSRPEDPKLGDVYESPDGNQFVVTKTWRTAGAKSLDAKLHLTFMWPENPADDAGYFHEAGTDKIPYEWKKRGNIYEENGQKAPEFHGRDIDTGELLTAPSSVRDPGSPAEAPVTGNPATAKQYHGKTLEDWFKIRNADELPKGNARQAFARMLGVENRPSSILKALRNDQDRLRKRIAEIEKPPLEAAQAAPVEPNAEQPPLLGKVMGPAPHQLDPYNDTWAITIAVARPDLAGVSESSIRDSVPEDLRTQLKKVDRFKGSVVPGESGAEQGPAKVRLEFKSKEAAQKAYDHFSKATGEGSELGQAANQPLAAKYEPTGKASPVEKALEDYEDNGNISTVGELADKLEGLINEGLVDENLQHEIDRYRENAQEDAKEFGGRGDAEGYEEDFLSAVRKAVQKDKAAIEKAAAPSDQVAPIPGIESTPIGAVQGVPVYSGQKARAELTKRFGLPNNIGESTASPFGGPGVFFVDDANGGKVVAYAKLGSGGVTQGKPPVTTAAPAGSIPSEPPSESSEVTPKSSPAPSGSAPSVQVPKLERADGSPAHPLDQALSDLGKTTGMYQLAGGGNVWRTPTITKAQFHKLTIAADKLGWMPVSQNDVKGKGVTVDFSPKPTATERQAMGLKRRIAMLQGVIDHPDEMGMQLGGKPVTPEIAREEIAKAQAELDKLTASDQAAPDEGIKDKILGHWRSQVEPALHDFFQAVTQFGVDRLERNNIKPRGISVSEWLEKVAAQGPVWGKGGSKTGSTGIQMLSQKGLWPTEGPEGETLRKNMLAAVKALKNAPGRNSDWIRNQEESPTQRTGTPETKAPTPEAKPDIISQSYGRGSRVTAHWDDAHKKLFVRFEGQKEAETFHLTPSEAKDLIKKRAKLDVEIPDATPEAKPAKLETPPAPESKPVVVKPEDKGVKDAVAQANLPTADSLKHLLNVPVADVTDAKEAAKFADRQVAELEQQRKKAGEERKALERVVVSSRGWKKGRIKSSAKKADVARYQELGKQISELNNQAEGIRRASAKDRLASENAAEAARANDTTQPLIQRVGARIRMFGASGEPAPKELSDAFRVLAQEEVRKRYPDATKAEIEDLAGEVQRSAQLHNDLDKEFEFNPALRSLYDRRRTALENVAFQNPNAAPYQEFSKDLTDQIARFTTMNRPSEWYSKPVEKVSAADFEKIKAQVQEETEAFRKNAAELAAKREAEAAAEKAKEAALIEEAQHVADSLPHVGRKGAPSADKVRESLMARVGAAIDETIERSGVTLKRREDGSYVAEPKDASIWSTGEVEETKTKKGEPRFKTTAWRGTASKDNPKLHATFKTLAEAEWFIKGIAAEAPGRAVIGVPGDGVYALNRSGRQLVETWLKAKGLETGVSDESTSRAPSSEEPPTAYNTVGAWNEQKAFHGLEPQDKIAEFSPTLKTMADKVAAKLNKPAKSITTQMVDDWIKTKAQQEDKPSMGPGAAASAEFEERGPDSQVVGLNTGNPVWNRISRQFRNFYTGVRQLGVRGPIKRDFAQLMDAADNLPRLVGQEAGNSVRIRATLPEQKAVTVLMQALKMSGQGVDAQNLQRLGDLEHFGDPIGYLRTQQTDLETYAQEQLHKGNKLEAAAALDLAQSMKLARERFTQLRPLAELVNRKLNYQLEREARAGINTDYEAWYVPQRHDLDLMTSSNRPIILGHSRGTGIATGFRKAKVFEDYSSAVQAGFMPRSTSIADLLEHRVAQGERLITHKAFFGRLHDMVDPLDNKPIGMPIPRRVITRPDGSVDVQETIPRGYSKQEVIPGVSIAIHDGYARLMRALTASSQISESAIVGTLQDVAAFEKHLSLALDTFHASRTMQAELALTHKLSLGDRQRLGRALVEYNPRDLDAAVNAGEITQEMADYIRKPEPVTIGGKVYSLTPRAVLNIGTKSGLNIARFADNMYRDWIRDLPVTGTVNKWVFDKMSRSALAHSFISEFKRVAAAHPEWNANRVGLNVARDINVIFGNLQKESLFRNPSVRAINQIVFLAPQWVESLARREGRTLVQFGQAANDLLHGQSPRLGSVGRTVGTGLAAYVVATQLVNLITRGHLTFQNPEEGHRLDAWLPGGQNGFFVSPLSVFGEITHDIYRLSHSKPDLAAAVMQIGANKMGNIGRMLEVMATGRDSLTGEKLIGTARRAIKAGVQLVPIPITVSAGVRDLAARAGLGQAPPSGSFQRQATASLGFKTEPVASAQNQIYAIADRWKSAQGGKLAMEVQRRLKEDFGPSDYRDLRGALGRNDAKGAAMAYQALRAEGKTPRTILQTIGHPHPFTGSAGAESRFRSSLTPEQRELYHRAIEERRELARRLKGMLQNRSQP